ncbi:hypothetical protein IEQ34_005473 [Dendrobium chrysotoxum]|uniref:Uncharacterized protein n=1 Tax=Dendrobium chrysotoxum TaxID=161865 RepID=A0AAV7HB61_DENCH|nr:hypothetical protein IEQ34_005473 [Dendrobium chrysotoxum]
MEMKVEFELPPVEFNKEAAEVSSAETQPPIMPLLESSAAIECSALPPEPSTIRPPPSPASKNPSGPAATEPAGASSSQPHEL